MKQHYKTGIYAVFSFLLVAVAYLIWMQQLPQVKSVTKVITMKKNRKAPASTTPLQDIQQQLVRREYSISFDEQKSAMQSPNRRHGLRAYYKPGVFTLENRIDSAGHKFSLQLVNEGIYADGKKILSAQANAVLESHQDTLLIRHAGFTEEFINNEDGVRQNFIIEAAPQATKALQVRLSAKGLKVNDLESNALLFYKDNNKGQRMASLVYKDIRCWDAHGKTLPATLGYADGLVRLSVDVHNAAYPVTIDPIIANGSPANASTSVESNQAEAWLGSVVASAGDVNGDGYSDVLACASKYDNGQVDEGAIFVYYGSALGINAVAPTILESDQKEARFGAYASSAGDINKDGYSDIVVGAHMYDKGEINEGAAFVYLGSAQGISKTASQILESNQAEANMGSSVGLAGDVNGDGYSDILVGATMYDKGQVNEGAAFLYLGSATGLNTNPTLLEENQAAALFGYRVSGAGDINGDGYSDILVSGRQYDKGQTDEGAVFVYHGSALGINAVAAKVLESNQANAYLGHSLNTAGDVNGDGYSDIIVGASMYDNGQANEGAVFVHYGSVQGINTIAAITLEKNQAEAQFGNSVASAGDVNGDGYSDVIIGALFYDNGESNEGAGFVYHGSSVGLSAISVSTLEGNQAAAQLGNIVASAGDVNGDGYSDVIAGAPLYDKGQVNEGAAFVWMGKADGVSSLANVKIEKDKPEALFGLSVAKAGDVNGDGFGDIIVGAPGFDNGQNDEGAAFVYPGSASGIHVNAFTMLESNKADAYFGKSVSGAGDVNGDGYDDVIVGAPYYSGGQLYEGAASVYYGSASGINIIFFTQLESNHADALFGYSLANAGDVNGDGYGDIVIGAQNYDNDKFHEGAIYVYHGSQAGILPQSFLLIESDKETAYLGASVSGAGDVNADGFADIIAGMPLYSKDHITADGAATLYYGSQNGISKQNNITIEGNDEESEFGTSVAGAGDVNGDGFADVLIGAPDEIKPSKVLIYYGSTSGLNISMSSRLEIDRNVYGNYARFGTDVSSAGDINGDGYSDIMVGATQLTKTPYQGAAFLYFGSASGILSGAIANEILPSDKKQVSTHSTAISASGAGDLNGDGLGDIILGSYQYKYGTSELTGGTALVYYGSRTGGIQNNLRLYNSNLTTIINQSQKAKNDFGAGLYAKSFLGSGKGKLVWETKPKGQAFSKGSNNVITNSTAYSGAQNTYTSLGLKGTELKNVVAKQGTFTKVRTRVKYDPALALTGQIYGPWRYVPGYLTGSSTAPARENVISNMSETIKAKTKSESEKYVNAVSIYPNPVTDKLFIETVDVNEIKSIQLLSITGKSVYRSTISVKQVDVNGLAAGSYMLVITYKDGLKNSKKVLITK
ncbi:T9SS type A sorting domain-containing protein [Dyadobacter flavalbus]|uniref:T9SS type A sorting domain-containing protein n=1 Tax=Dyadobacter flavalbus TaxID=2579942 RepID=A0A5M8QT56_9BACT|nr:FG-GAP-like repeat-containing protein [Dyadobacter flavalbus]KAA6439309.1 T9SS type A sorting domain-containing protein [Dyadobacter flavalbus]